MQTGVFNAAHHPGKVTLVFKEGVGYDSPTLIESVKELVSLR